MGSEHLNEQEQEDRAEAQAQLNRHTQMAMEGLRRKRAQRHLPRPRQVAQAQLASPPDGRGKPAEMDAERIALGLGIAVYQKNTTDPAAFWYWSAAAGAQQELNKCVPLAVESEPFTSSTEAAENALVVLAQALGGVVRQLSTRMPAVRS